MFYDHVIRDRFQHHGSVHAGVDKRSSTTEINQHQVITFEPDVLQVQITVTVNNILYLEHQIGYICT